MRGRYKRYKRRTWRYSDSDHWLKDVMRSMKVKQRSVANVTGISPTKLSQYLNGWRFMPYWIEDPIKKAMVLLGKNTPDAERRELAEYFYPSLRPDREEEDDIVKRLFPHRK